MACFLVSMEARHALNNTVSRSWADACRELCMVGSLLSCAWQNSLRQGLSGSRGVWPKSCKESKENSPRPVWDSHSIQAVVWSDMPRGRAHRWWSPEAQTDCQTQLPCPEGRERKERRLQLRSHSWRSSMLLLISSHSSGSLRQFYETCSRNGRYLLW